MRQSVKTIMLLWFHLLPLRTFARIQRVLSNNQSEKEENLMVSPAHDAHDAMVDL